MSAFFSFNVIAVIAGVIVFVPLYFLFPDSNTQYAFLFSLACLALSVTNLIYGAAAALRKKTETSKFGTPGIEVGFALVVLLLAALAFILSISGFYRLSAVFVFVTCGVWLAMTILKAVVTKKLDAIEIDHRAPSSHRVWHDNLALLSRQCKGTEAEAPIKRLADNCAYLSDDTAGVEETNANVEAKIALLTQRCREKNTENIQQIVGDLEFLLQQREIVLKSLRRKG
jgi:Na+/melibiose symporter-like transporter